MGKYNIKTVPEKKAILDCWMKHGWKATFEKYSISRGSAGHWKKRLQEDGTLERRPKTHIIRQDTVEYVKQLRKKYPDYTVDKLRDAACKKQKISRTTVWHIIHD